MILQVVKKLCTGPFSALGTNYVLFRLTENDRTSGPNMTDLVCRQKAELRTDK